MAHELETFLLYYTCWHEHEFGLQEMKQLLLGELGVDGLGKALEEFRVMLLPFREVGDRRIYYDIQKVKSV